MADKEPKNERKSGPTRRRRSRASDADAEVNPPGEPSHLRAAPGWERRSKEMPGRQGTMKTAPWTDQEQNAEAHISDPPDEGEELEDEGVVLPKPARPPPG